MASLVGRFIRTFTLFVAFCAVVSAHAVQAAPFAGIVMDARSGEVLWEQNADSRLHPASLTKMMTLYIAFQEIEAGRLSLDTVVTVSKHAAAQPPSKLGLKPGQKIKLRYLIRAAAIKSANDAATAIGEHIGDGSEPAFAKRMTRTAKALGMRATSFRNANGLTAEGHLSSARDMTMLGRHLFYDFPQYYNIFSRRTADAGMAQVTNTNSRFLAAYEGADGIKTGYTVAAGFNLTASAKRGDKRIIATVFGGSSTAQRNAKMTELMNIGFGKARNGVREKAPVPADVEGDPVADLIAESVTINDTPGVPGGAAKTIRVSGAVTKSLRPKARPVAEAAAVAVAEVAMEPVPDAVAMAIAAGVADALSEANAAPPPAGTLEAQAVAMAEAPPANPAPEVAAEVAPLEQLAEVAAPAAPPGSLEAQAAALAGGAAPAETPAPTSLEAQAVLLAETTGEAAASLRPQPRPERAATATPEVTQPETVLAEAPAPATETVAPLEEVMLAETVEDAAPVALLAEIPAPAADISTANVTAIETVAAPVEEVVPSRKAPIFDSVQMAEAPAEPQPEDLVVVSKSTSGGSYWAVNVGGYNSRSEAERGLLKAGLAESATLDQGARKVTQSGGKYRASFIGLSQDQADLACRRLRARGMACETVSPG